MKIHPELNLILQTAYREAMNRRHEYLSPEHMLYASLFFEPARDIIESCGADPEALKTELDSFLSEKFLKLEQEEEPVQTEALANIMERAFRHVVSSQKGEVDFGDVIVSLFDEPESFAAWALQKQGVKAYSLGGGYSETFGPAGSDKHHGLRSQEAYDLLAGYIAGAVELSWS